MKNPLRSRTIVLTAVLLASVSGAMAQDRLPNVGYIYPAGGRRGDYFEVTVGGQFLKGVTDVYFSGKGVKAEVVKYIKPLTKKQINDLRKKFQMLSKSIKGAARKRPAKVRYAGIAPKFNAYAKKEMGLKDMDLQTYFEVMKKYKDPKRQPNAQIAEQIILKIKIDRDAEPGSRELRFKTMYGLSNPRLFQVDEFKEYRETEPNNKVADKAISGSLPAIINGQIMPGDVDRFEFRATKGARVVISTSARELIPYLADAVPGWFQAVIALYDEKGARVAYADDYRFDPDPVLRFQVPQTGRYVLEIKDSIYRGREDFVYRITIGPTPFVTSIFPLGGRVGAKTVVQTEGWNLPALRMMLDNKNKAPGVVPISVRKGRRSSNRVPFALDTLPETRDAEPNNTKTSAQKIKLPLIINGRVNRPGDWDVFSFTGKKGDRIVARVQARGLGSPMDSLLKLTDAAGKTLASNDDYVDKGAGLITHHADSMVSMKLPADGTYLLHIGDTQNKGGAEYGYRLRIGASQPDFALRVVPSGISAKVGSIVPITVYALRKDGFSDSIDLSLVDAPDGFSLTGARIPAGQDKVRLTLVVPRKPLDQPAFLKLVGRSVIDKRQAARTAVPAEDMMQAFLYRHLVTADSWMVAVNKRGRWTPPWKVLTPAPLKITPGQTARVRFSGYKGTASARPLVDLNNPPAGFSIGKITHGPNGAWIEFELKVDPAKVEPGLKSNLIVNAYMMRTWKSKDGKKRPPRRNPLGVLPAIPFEIVDTAKKSK